MSLILPGSVRPLHSSSVPPHAAWSPKNNQMISCWSTQLFIKPFMKPARVKPYPSTVLSLSLSRAHFLSFGFHFDHRLSLCVTKIRTLFLCSRVRANGWSPLLASLHSVRPPACVPFTRVQTDLSASSVSQTWSGLTVVQLTRSKQSYLETLAPTRGLLILKTQTIFWHSK